MSRREYTLRLNAGEAVPIAAMTNRASPSSSVAAAARSVVSAQDAFCE
jgi:hypothetical protein